MAEGVPAEGEVKLGDQLTGCVRRRRWETITEKHKLPRKGPSRERPDIHRVAFALPKKALEGEELRVGKKLYLDTKCEVQFSTKRQKMK